MGYKVAFHDDMNLITTRVEGHWDEATMDAFSVDILAAFARARRASARSVCLCDARGYGAQSTAVAQKYAEFWERNRASLPDRVAVIMDSTLASMQSRRIIPDERMRNFSDEDAARAWLFAIS